MIKIHYKLLINLFLLLNICIYYGRAQQEKFQKIKLCVKSDYPPNEVLDPEIAMLNGKDIREQKFKSGKYYLEIQHPGFFPIREKLFVCSKKKVIEIKKVLISKHRLIKLRISFDVLPLKTEVPYKVTLISTIAPEKEIEIKEGGKIKPGKYILCIAKEGYQKLKIEKEIWPSEEPLIIEQEMHAKWIPLDIRITGDRSLQELPQAYVELRPIYEKTGCWVKSGMYVKPGKYYLAIYCPGYLPFTKEIFISPDKKNYKIYRKLVAKSRRLLVLTMAKDSNNNLAIFPIKVINKCTGKKINSQKLLKVGKKYTLKFQFRQHETIEKQIKVISGEGPLSIILPTLKELKNYKILLLGNWKKYIGISLDGIKYPYIIKIDSRFVESHLIKTKVANSGILYTILASKKAQRIQIFAGYMYTERKLDQSLITVKLDSISIPRLVEHLKQIKKISKSNLRNLQILENNFHNQQWLNMLQVNSKKEKNKLRLYLQKIKLQTFEEQNCRMKILYILNKLDK